MCISQKVVDSRDQDRMLYLEDKLYIGWCDLLNSCLFQTLTGKEIEIDIEPTDKVMYTQHFFMPVSLHVHLFGYADELSPLLSCYLHSSCSFHFHGLTPTNHG